MAEARRNSVGYLKALSILVLLAFILFLIAPRSEVEKQMTIETDSIAEFYGEGTFNNVYNTATRWYRTFVISTNVRKKALDAMSLSKTVGEDETITESFGGRLAFLVKWMHGADSYLECRVELFFDIIWWFLLRLSMLMHWLPLWLPILCCACYNGICQKNIKLMSFGYSNPSLLRLSGRSISMAVFVGFIAFAIPWAIPPIAIPIIFGVIVCGAGFMICNFQWRF